MTIRIPSLAVLLLALAVGALAVWKENTVIAAVCLSIAAVYAVALAWRWRDRRKSK